MARLEPISHQAGEFELGPLLTFAQISLHSTIEAADNCMEDLNTRPVFRIQFADKRDGALAQFQLQNLIPPCLTAAMDSAVAVKNSTSLIERSLDVRS